MTQNAETVTLSITYPLPVEWSEEQAIACRNRIIEEATFAVVNLVPGLSVSHIGRSGT